MNNKLKLSAIGLVLIALFEGYSYLPYIDQAGVKTNGFGNTHNAGQPVSVPVALKTLERNTTEAGQAVNNCIKVPLTQNQYDALVSWVFNVGTSAACKSTLVKYANQGRWQEACDQLLRWNKTGGKINKGLQARRQQEYELCMKP